MLALAKGGLRSVKELSMARAAPPTSSGARVLSPPLPGEGYPGLGMFEGREVVGAEGRARPQRAGSAGGGLEATRSSKAG